MPQRVNDQHGRAVLLVAFHFPPLGESSGLQRTLSLANDLAEMGWRPIVLSVSRKTYRSIRDDQIVDIDHRVKVYRAYAMDAARDLSIAGKYPRFVALPDVWATWVATGLLTGLWIALKHKPVWIWSTYPIASAHLLALLLTRIARRPWIVDFRDSMTEETYPADKLQRRVYRWIEKRAVACAYRCVFTTQGAFEMYSKRYPKHATSFSVVPNGYDERYFAEVDAARGRQPRQPDGLITLLHSGIVYPSERDPTHLFDALRCLKTADGIDGTRLRVVLRASGSEETYRAQIDALKIGDIVQLEPAIGYRQALLEMATVTGLLVLQASNCNHQIPAKIYEYLRSGTPILALTDPKGDTARVLLELGIDTLAPLDDTSAIHDLLLRFIDSVEQGTMSVVAARDVPQFSRKRHALALEQLTYRMG